MKKLAVGGMLLTVLAALVGMCLAWQEGYNIGYEEGRLDAHRRR